MDGASRRPVRSDMVERYKLKEETSFVARHQTLKQTSAVTPQTRDAAEEFVWSDSNDFSWVLCAPR